MKTLRSAAYTVLVQAILFLKVLDLNTVFVSLCKTLTFTNLISDLLNYLKQRQKFIDHDVRLTYKPVILASGAPFNPRISQNVPSLLEFELTDEFDPCSYRKGWPLNNFLLLVSASFQKFFDRVELLLHQALHEIVFNCSKAAHCFNTSTRGSFLNSLVSM